MVKMKPEEDYSGLLEHASEEVETSGLLQQSKGDKIGDGSPIKGKAVLSSILVMLVLMILHSGADVRQFSMLDIHPSFNNLETNPTFHEPENSSTLQNTFDEEGNNSSFSKKDLLDALEENDFFNTLEQRRFRTSEINIDWIDNPKKMQWLQENRILKKYQDNSYAVTKLFNMMRKLKRGENITIVSVGGSPTVIVPYIDRVVSFFSALGSEGQVLHYNMGHGNQNSFHASYMMDSFLPPNPDLVIWEFSINDILFTPSIGFKPSPSREFQSYPLKAFLNSIRNTPGETPLVLLGVLWPNPRNHYGNHSLEQMIETGEEFPNVLGYVHLGNFRNSLSGRISKSKTEYTAMTIYDNMHPSAEAGYFLSDLFLYLIVETLLGPVPHSFVPPTLKVAASDYSPVTCEWAHPKEKEILNRFYRHLMESKQYPQSWILNKPRLKNLGFKIANKRKPKMILTSKITHGRFDRRSAMVLPTCPKKIVLKPTRKVGNATYILLSGERFMSVEEGTLWDSRWFLEIKGENEEYQAYRNNGGEHGVINVNDGTSLAATNHKSEPCMAWVQSEHILEVNITFTIREISICLGPRVNGTLPYGGIQLLSLV